jgi:hypothetical protein
MFNQNASNIGTAVIIGALLLVLLGGITVAGASDADILNWQRSAAEAEQIRANTAWEIQLHHIGLPFLKVEREAQAGAELARIAAERDADVATIQENLRVQAERNNRRLITEAWIVNGLLALGLSLGALLVLSIGLAFLKVAWRLADRVPTGPSGQILAEEHWRDASFRRRQIALARDRERLARRPLAAESQRHSANGR